MIVYIDCFNKCHTTNDGTMEPIDLEFFDGKCKTYIEGFKCVKDADSIENDTYSVFAWRNYSLLEEFQRQYEEMLAEFSEMH